MLNLSHGTAPLDPIPQVLIQDPVGALIVNPAGQPGPQSWWDGWNIFMRKKNWICLYGAFIELFATLVLMLVWIANSNYMA
jgi:hypothetical protein